MTSLSRRELLRLGVAATASSLLNGACVTNPIPARIGGDITPATLPRWRGFNLLEKFTHEPDEWYTVAPEWGYYNDPFLEWDFEWIKRWGFDFVRLPMSYKCWVDPREPTRFVESKLKEIDQAVDWGRQYGIHVSINFHRAPGYCVNRDSGEGDALWTDPRALDLCALHWRTFAERYNGIPNRVLSFNLINEPWSRTFEEYLRVHKRLIREIRSIDASRLIICDLRSDEMITGKESDPELNELGVVFSPHHYEPTAVTHYLARWAGFPEQAPTWPMGQYDAAWLRERFKEWGDVRRAGQAVHVGECGVWRKTPHAATLGWMRDSLAALKEQDLGWALWCFRGPNGVLDSHRKDVTYEQHHGHLLDRKMLETIQQG